MKEIEIPMNREAEMICLGLAMQYQSDLDVACEMLKLQMFSTDENIVVFDSLKRFQEKSYKPDVSDISFDLMKNGKLEAIGGRQYLSDLAKFARSGDIRFYCNEVIKAWKQRELLAEGQRMMESAKMDPEDQIARVSEKLVEVGHSTSRSTKTLRQAIASYKEIGFRESIESNEPSSAIGLRWPKFNDLIGGLVSGRMIVIAARPGLGKTDFICHMISDLIDNEISGCSILFSLEMNADEVCNRLIGIGANIPHRKIDTKNLTEDECRRSFLAADVLVQKGANRLVIDDSVNLNVNKIRSIIRREQAKRDVKIVFIDHLGLLESETKETSRYEIITESSRRLKILAKETNTCVIVLSQLNRQCTQRSNARPNMSDLRDSGSIEQDADQVILLHRDDYVKDNENVGVVDAIVDKNRHGDRGVVKFFYDALAYSLEERSVGPAKKAVSWAACSP